MDEDFGLKNKNIILKYALYYDAAINIYNKIKNNKLYY